MTLTTLVVRYSLFAVLATLANLATQRLVLLWGTEPVFYVSAIGAGTIVGLINKYLLDKRWIFYDTGTGLKSHGRKFTLYTAMGLITTAIFWGSETLFWLVWGTELMREFGAILGLTIGYMVKYNLDRRFVFTDAALARGAAS